MQSLTKAVRSLKSKYKNSECIVFGGQLTGQFSPDYRAFAFLLVINMTELICGVGVNDLTGYSKTPFYKKWSAMLHRVYGSVYGNNDNSPYKNCSTCDSWLVFSSFKLWMESKDWVGNHLDKDILSVGDKIYSPETCCFIPSNVNQFLISPHNTTNNLPSGVWVRNYKNSYAYRATVTINNKTKNLGLFHDPIDAYNAWVEAKREAARSLSISINDLDVRRSFISYIESDRFYIERLNGYEVSE